MIHVTEDRNFLGRLNALIAGAPKLLDIGSGPGALLNEIHAGKIVALDIHKPYVDHIAIHYPSVIPVHANALDIGSLFRPGTFTAVTMVDVLEHLDKKDGYELLKVAELVASERVILFTPRGFFPQEGIDHYGLNGELHQMHRSGWEPEELAALGYEVTVMKGFHDATNMAFVRAFGSGHPPIDALMAVKRIG